MKRQGWVKIGTTRHLRGAQGHGIDFSGKLRVKREERVSIDRVNQTVHRRWVGALPVGMGGGGLEGNVGGGAGDGKRGGY